MKKIIIIIALLVLPVVGFCQGTIVQTYDSPLDDLDMIRVTLTCVGDGATGAFPVTALDSKIVELVRGRWLYYIVTIPGATAPTALYDVAILETRSGKTYDVVGGALANRSATLAERTVPLFTAGVNIFGGVVHNLNSAWQISITNNSVASANIVIELHFVR